MKKILWILLGFALVSSISISFASDSVLVQDERTPLELLEICEHSCKFRGGIGRFSVVGLRFRPWVIEGSPLNSYKCECAE